MADIDGSPSTAIGGELLKLSRADVNDRALLEIDINGDDGASLFSLKSNICKDFPFVVVAVVVDDDDVVVAGTVAVVATCVDLAGDFGVIGVDCSRLVVSLRWRWDRAGDGDFAIVAVVVVAVVAVVAVVVGVVALIVSNPQPSVESSEKSPKCTFFTVRRFVDGKDEEGDVSQLTA